MNRNVWRVLTDIGGHVDRNHRSRPGAHATAAQHRAWRAARPDLKAEANARYRAKQRQLAAIRAKVLEVVMREDADLAERALHEAIAGLDT